MSQQSLQPTVCHQASSRARREHAALCMWKCDGAAKQIRHSGMGRQKRWHLLTYPTEARAAGDLRHTVNEL
jgi:hypothetical protein